MASENLFGSEFLQSLLPPVSWTRIKAQKALAHAELLEGLCGFWGTAKITLSELEQHEPAELMPFFEVYAERQFEAYAEELLANFPGTAQMFHWHLVTDVVDVIIDGIRPRFDLLSMRGGLDSDSEIEKLMEWAERHSGDWEHNVHRSFQRQTIKAGLDEPKRGTVLFVFKYLLLLRDFKIWRAFDQRMRVHLSNRLPFWMSKAYLHLPDQAEQASTTPVPNGGSGDDTGPDATAVGTEPELVSRADWVDTFLLRCIQEVGLKATRKHIWRAAGHRSPRQFEFWQASSPKATKRDDVNFRRILALNPADLVSLLKKMKIF